MMNSRLAPRCIAGLKGEVWRMAPSPKYWSFSKTGRNKKGMERLAIKWSQRQLHPRPPCETPVPKAPPRDAARVERDRIRVGRSTWRRCRCPADASCTGFAGCRPKCNCSRNRFHNGVFVEDRMRRMHQPAAGDECQHPVHAGPEHAHGIGFEHMVHAKFAPHPLDGIDRVPEVRPHPRRERPRADGAGGGFR